MKNTNSKTIKILIISISTLFLFGCAHEEVQSSVQEYNNQMIAYQIQAIEYVENYFLSLENEYDGKNLAKLYLKMREELNALSSGLLIQEGWKGDLILKNAVMNYLSGLQFALAEYEMPIVEMLAKYAGSAENFYHIDKEKVNQYTLGFAKALVELDRELEQQQAIFADKYNYALK